MTLRFWKSRLRCIAMTTKSTTIKEGFMSILRNCCHTTYFEKENDLFNWIVSDTKNTTEVKRLKERNFKYRDGQASKRIIESIF